MAVDFSTEGANPLTFSRHFVRKDKQALGISTATMLGSGWRSNFDSKMYQYANWFFFTLPEGRGVSFIQASTGVFSPAYRTSFGTITSGGKGIRESLAKNTAGEYELTTSNGTIYIYNVSTGRLLHIRFRGGYVQTLVYDDNSKLLASVNDNLGRYLNFTYDDQRHLAALAANGTTVATYSYLDRTDNSLIGPYFPAGVPAAFKKSVAVLETATLINATNEVTTYHYEDTANRFALTGVTDARGVRYATWTYDAQARAISSTHAGGVDQTTIAYDRINNKTTVTNPLGKQEVINYTKTSQGNLLPTSYVGQPSASCPLSNTTTVYDVNEFRAQITDAEGRVTSYVNDGLGQPTSITRGAGSSTASTSSYSWNTAWRVPNQIVEPGVTTDYVWSPTGTLTSRTLTDTTTHTSPYTTSGQSRKWTYTYGTAGLLTSVNGPLSGTGDTVNYTYDALGYVQTVTNELGQVTTVDTINSRGQPTLVTDANGVKTALSYDALGRLLTITTDSLGAAAVTTITYDAIGQITKVTKADGSWQSFSYDGARRLTTVTNNSGETTTYVRDAMGGATSITRRKADSTTTFTRTQTFDELGRLLRAIGANASTWGFGYDKTDSLVVVTDPRSNLYSYGFDALNRLISETNEDSEVVQVTRNGLHAITGYTDPRSLTTSYVRNGFGEVIQSVSPDRGTTVYQRDARGLITQKADGRGIVTNHTYDNAGRILTRSFPSDSSLNVGWTYDDVTSGNKGKGRLTGMSDASGTTSWFYDARGNVLSEALVIAGKRYVVAYAYDLVNKVTKITYPSGRIIDIARDATGRVGGITTKQTATASSAVLASGVVYQPFGDVQSLTYGNGLSLLRTFTVDDELDQLLVVNSPTGVAVVKRLHGRQDNGLNLTNIYANDDISPPPHQTFWYSPSRKLQNANGVWGELTFYYGPGGNRTHEVLTQGATTSSKVTSYAASSNRMLQVLTDNVVTRSFGYDNAGNISADTRGSAAWSFTHNAAGRLSQASVGGTLKGTYTYDGLERLAIRAATNSTPSGTTHLIYDTAGHLLAEANAISGATVREYVWLEVEDQGADLGPTNRPDNDNGGAGGNLGAAENDNDPTARAQLPSLNWPKRGIAARAIPLAVVADVDTPNPTTLFVHADHLDRPVRMTNASQALVWDAVYRPYGEVESISGWASLDTRFPGQWFQLETGLHHNWHRTYDPTTGRYLQPDPLGFVDGPSVYAYANGSPLMRTDRDGLSSSTSRQSLIDTGTCFSSTGIARVAASPRYSCQNVECGAPTGTTTKPLCPDCATKLKNGMKILLENGKILRPGTNLFP